MPAPKKASPSARGYGVSWQKLRLAFLKVNPLCADCRLVGRTTAATHVDHIKPHGLDQVLLYAWDNFECAMPQLPFAQNCIWRCWIWQPTRQAITYWVRRQRLSARP